MKYNLPVYPYHTNARKYWMQIEGHHLEHSYWSWMIEEYGAYIDVVNNKDYWSFNTEKERDWFVLRWA